MVWSKSLQMDAREGMVATRQRGGACKQAATCTPNRWIVGVREFSEQNQCETTSMGAPPHFDCNQCVWEEWCFSKPRVAKAKTRERGCSVQSDWKGAAACRYICSKKVHPTIVHKEQPTLAPCIMASLPTGQAQVYQNVRLDNGLMPRCMQPWQ